MMKKTKNTMITLLAFLVVIWMFYGCSGESVPPAGNGEAEKSVEKTSEKPEADLTVPPPGSQATQEKWDSFDEAKKQESWDKYLASLTEGTADSSPEEESAPVKTTTEKSVAVVVAPLSKAPMEVYYYGLGEVEAGKVMKVTPPISGTAQKVYVSPGDFVEPGDLLFSLDSSDWVKDIERAGDKWDAELRLAEVRLNEAVKTLESTQAFYDRDLVTRQELDKAQQGVTEAGLNLEKVRISRATELESLQDNYQSRLGVSNSIGYVSSLSFSEGEAVNTADFVEIVNLDEVLLSVEVPESIITRVETGAPVQAKVASAPRYGMEGLVTGHSILPESNRTYQVRVTLENPNERLLPGMLMEVQIQVSQLHSRFIVPRQAVVSDGTGNFLYLAVDSVSKRVPVTLGAGRQGMVQVEGDFTEGDLVVIEGQSYLKPGTPLNIREERGYLPERTEL